MLFKVMLTIGLF